MIAARTDGPGGATHRACVAAIRATGLHVRDLSRVGQGAADLLVTDHLGRAVEVEVKDGKKAKSARRLTPAQVERMGTRFWVVGCPKCASRVAWYINLGVSENIPRDNCCGVGGPVDAMTYWKETK